MLLMIFQIENANTHKVSPIYEANIMGMAE